MTIKRAARMVVAGMCMQVMGCGSASDADFVDATLTTPQQIGQPYSLVRTVDDLHLIKGMVVSGNYIFFSIDWQGVYRIPKYGGELQVVERDRDAVATTLAANDSEVFWTHSTFGANDEATTRLRRRAASGGPITELPIPDPDIIGGRSAADASHVYLMNHTSLTAISLEGTHSVSINYPGMTTSMDSPEWVVDDPFVYMTSCSHRFSSAVADRSSCALTRGDLNTGVVETVANLPSRSGEIADYAVFAVDESSVYLRDTSGVVRISKGDFSTTETFAADGEAVLYTLVDATAAYFISYVDGGGRLRAVPRNGGAPTIIGQVDGSIWGVGQDDQFIFVLAAHEKTNDQGMSDEFTDISAFPKNPAP